MVGAASKPRSLCGRGFGEVGAEGVALEQQFLDAAGAYNVRLLGPNCIGTINADLPLDTTLLHSAYTQIMGRIRETLPGARIDGIHIQRQIRDGQEVILGAVRDPQFGPLMMFGSGGVEVERLKDVAFALAPLDPAEAEKMIRRTWAGRRLQGFRHIPPADQAAAVDVLIKLSHLILEHDSIQEIEINPSRVLKQSAIAVDVRVK